ncbi:hypothetical protein GTO91_08720 [Heliobacterium undosum]|uniref:DUF4149 domain-containing protein n=1 Tax=Heliomicrobium undosum TaxID=121734 RepID=A0A845L043_9FIRM|nr:hypothetical protein [Heliomicrobium undosum]MZP29787.1 hypothetical protein [Heliomicrobium undosum]
MITGLIWRVTWSGAGLLVFWWLGYVLGDQLHRNGWLHALYWAGIAGTLMVLLALGYSIKKRYKAFPGRMVFWLQAHVVLTVLGNLLICIHVGGRTHALVPWMTFIVFLIVMISGQIGYFLHFYIKQKLAATKRALLEQGNSREEAEEELAWVIAGENLLSGWRRVHFPLNITLALALTLHIVSAVYYRGW